MTIRRRPPVSVAVEAETTIAAAYPRPRPRHGLIKPTIYPWPPPNAIVLHAATPIQLSQAGSGLRVYFIDRNGNSEIGPFFDNFTILANNYHGDPVVLYEGSNPGTGKPVTIEYLPAEKRLRVSTFYADRPPHDFNKPYIFTVDGRPQRQTPAMVKAPPAAAPTNRRPPI